MLPVLTVVVATRNPGKVAEIRAALEGLPIGLTSVADILKDAPPIEETGATFEENAIIKARAVSEATHLVALADDSGLEVDALGGRPGVRSARFARDGATDAENNAKLLADLLDIPSTERKARFRCVMALWDPFSDDEPVISEGSCDGWIGQQGRGTGGFGYDPLFVVDETGRTFAELTTDEKLAMSHRGRALRGMRERIGAMVEARQREASAIASLANKRGGP
jgi:XTP/dITP diphosphohydrolase